MSSTEQVILPTGRTEKWEDSAAIIVEIDYLMNPIEHHIVHGHKTLKDPTEGWALRALA